MPTTARLLATLTLLSLLACRTAGRGASEPPPPTAVAPVVPVALQVEPRLGLEMAQGELTLPARYLRPILRPAPGETGVSHLFLVRPPPPPARAPGEEAEEADEEEEGATAASAQPGAKAPPDPPVVWKVFALRRAARAEVTLELIPEAGAPAQRIGWAIGKGQPATAGVLQEWAAARLFALDLWGAGDGPLQRPILAAAIGAYGLAEGRYQQLVEPRDGRGTGDGSPSLLALLGGRAAVDETLQLDRELEDGDDRAGGATVPIDQVPGITVAAHPWKELLAGRKAPSLPLARCVPPDRALLYLPRPAEAIDGLEHGGAGFLQRVSSFARQGKLDYAVVERYLEDLGLGDGLGRKLLKAGAVKEAAIFTSDLSLLSGTDVTVVAEISSLFLPLLPIAEGEVREKATPGGAAYKTRRGARVFLSNSRTELERAVALDAAGGAGSLGASDELAYLLLQLSPTERTQAFAYLSDPFIRRLVGPAQRIGQARIDRARGEMELLAGAALLRRQDRPGDVPTVVGLKRLGYLPPEFPEADYVLRPDGRVASQGFGPLERLHPVSRLGLASVTAAEAERYGDFRERYARYWRRFFDPIALRLDAAPDGGQALETFILPLLDSSIYRELARDLAPEARRDLRAPRWSLPVGVEASLQLPEKAAAELKGRGGPLRELEHLGLTLPPEVVAAIVPNVHVAFPDAAPILQVGGGSAFGVVAAPADRGEAFGIPMLVAALTRPMAIAVELKDPERVRAALARLPSPFATPAGRAAGRDVRLRLVRDADDRLIVTADLFGIVTLRQSVRVEDRWLVIANDTTLPARLIAGTRELPGAAASVALRPGALRLGLPSAWQAAADAEADAAWAAQHWLAPWLSEGATVAEAQGASRALLGSAPVLEEDAVVRGFNQTVEHKRYGTPWRPRLPPMDTERDFGLFEGVSEARVEMSFEQDGLRTRVTWRGAGR